MGIRGWPALARRMVDARKLFIKESLARCAGRGAGPRGRYRHRHLKDTSQDFARYVEYIDALGPDASVLMGSDAMVLAALAQGGSGAVSAAAATFPELMVAIKDRFLAGDLGEARRLQRAWAPTSGACS